MRSFIRRATAIFALSALVLTSPAGSAAVAADTLPVHDHGHEEEAVSQLYVSEKELASGEVLLVTAEMLDDNGNLIIDTGDWDKIVITRNINAKKIVLKAVTAKELVIESGSETAYEINGGTIAKTTVVSPGLEVIDYAKLCEMVASGMESSAIADALTTYQKEKAYVQEVLPELKVIGGAELALIVLMGNAKLDVTMAKVSDVKIDSNGVQEIVKIVLQGYNGALDVRQAPIASGVNNIVNLQLKASEITEFSVNGPEMSVCYMEGDKASFVTTVSVSGGTKLTLDVDATEIRMGEDAENAKVNLYSAVENMVVEGDNNAVRVAASAVIENAVVEGDNVRLGVTGKVNSADVTGTGSEMSYVPRNNTVNKVTPTPTPAPDTDCQHSDIVVYTKLKAGAETCLDGVEGRTYCTDCKQDIETWTSNVHDTGVKEFIDLSELEGCCGGYLYLQECPCGEYGGWNWEKVACAFEFSMDVSDVEAGVQKYYIERTCQECGYKMTEEFTSTRMDGCKLEQTGVLAIYANDTAVKTCEYSCGVEGHNVCAVAELAEGSKTCPDGVVVKSYCSICKQDMFTWTTTDHYVVETIIDMSAYEGFCGGTVSYYKCPCGEEQWLGHLPNCNTIFDGSNYEDDDGVEYELATETCSECSFYYTRHSAAIKNEDCSEMVNVEFKFYYGESLIASFADTFQRDAHDNYISEATLAEGSKTCTDGVVVKLYCGICKQDISTWTTTEHYTVETIIDMSAYEGFCGGTVSYYKCPCGEEQWLGQLPNCNTSYDVSLDEGDDGVKYELGTATCSDCSFYYTRYSAAIKNEDCSETVNVEYKFYYGESLIASLAETYQRDAHDNYISEATLAEGSTTCEEGVVFVSKCRECGETWSGTETFHLAAVKEIDLKEHGVECGGCIRIEACACGEFCYSGGSEFLCTTEYGDWNSIHYSGGGTEESIGENTTAYSHTCTECGFVYSFKAVKIDIDETSGIGNWYWLLDGKEIIVNSGKYYYYQGD